MADKTIEQLQDQIDLESRLKAERKESDDAYAAKIVQTIVFGFLATVASGIIIGIIALVLKRFK